MMSIINNYRVNVIDELLVSDLTKIWFESAKYTIEVFNAFERKRFGKENEITHSGEEELVEKVRDLVDWYNKLP